ncbi:MAG: hypothetical protein WC985_01585 [Thermoplasmata archaeon]
MAVPVLCHLCQRPTLATCRFCGLPACGDHLGPDGVCTTCRAGRRGPPPGVR